MLVNFALSILSLPPFLHLPPFWCFQFVALTLREYLLNGFQLCEDIGVNLSPALREEFKLLADCVYHVLVSGKGRGHVSAVCLCQEKGGDMCLPCACVKQR